MSLTTVLNEQALNADEHSVCSLYDKFAQGKNDIQMTHPTFVYPVVCYFLILAWHEGFAPQQLPICLWHMMISPCQTLSQDLCGYNKCRRAFRYHWSFRTSPSSSYSFQTHGTDFDVDHAQVTGHKETIYHQLFTEALKQQALETAWEMFTIRTRSSGIVRGLGL